VVPGDSGQGQGGDNTNSSEGGDDPGEPPVQGWGAEVLGAEYEARPGAQVGRGDLLVALTDPVPVGQETSTRQLNVKSRWIGVPVVDAGCDHQRRTT
jgi:hypothetical protein